MESCENFDCNKFKCPGYYCLPWSYVCDGKWDCPFGKDEAITQSCGQTRHCENMFKCIDSQVCIHIEDLCDTFNDCPLAEDEQMCDLKYTSCPVDCFCQRYAMFCNRSVSSLDWDIFSPLLSIQCDSMNLTSLSFLKHLTKLVFLKLPKNRIDSICGEFDWNTELLQIVLKVNLVTSLDEFCFVNTPLLHILDFDQNKIVQIHRRAFHHLTQLKLLILSHNQLRTVSEFVIYSSFLYVLSLERNPFHFLKPTIFVSSDIFLMVSDDFRICCVAPRSTLCFTIRMWYQSCSDLLPGLTLKTVVGTLAGLILLLNICSIGLQQYLPKHSKNAFRGIVLSVNISDLLYSFCLWILFAADQIYNDNFSTYSFIWQGNILCFITFVVSHHFSLMSPIVLTYMAITRLMIVLDPMNTSFKRNDFTLRNIACFTLLIFVISCCVGFFLKLNVPKLPSALCQPFIDPTHSVWMIKLTTVTISSIQMTSVLVIIFVCNKLVFHLQKVKRHMKPTVSRSYSYVSIYTQLVVVVFFNLFSWVPANVIHISSLIGVRYSTELVIWLTIIVTALNSVSNPIIFVVAAMRAQKTMKTMFSLLNVAQTVQSTSVLNKFPNRGLLQNRN